MEKEQTTIATLTYKIGNKEMSKKFRVPTHRYALGILNQWGGVCPDSSSYVEICWFKEPPHIGGYRHDNFQNIRIALGKGAGLATLWVDGCEVRS